MRSRWVEWVEWVGWVVWVSASIIYLHDRAKHTAASTRTTAQRCGAQGNDNADARPRSGPYRLSGPSRLKKQETKET